MNADSAPGTVVLVHGGFVDGSGWQGVYDLLRKDGYNVAVVQNPTLSLEGDVAATKMVIDAQDESVILVGHSYGGAVITEACRNRREIDARLMPAATAREAESRLIKRRRLPESNRCKRLCRPLRNHSAKAPHG